MNAMVRHAGGKHQSCIVLAIKPIEPRGDSWQEAGAPFGFAVGWQRPAASDGLSPQVHDVQVMVIEEEGKYLTKAEQWRTGWVLVQFDDPVSGIKDITCWTTQCEFLNIC